MDVDPYRTYCQKIMPEMKAASEAFADVELVCRDGRKLATNSLILASISPMMLSALRPLADSYPEDQRITIIADVLYDDLVAFIDRFLFCTELEDDFDDEPSQELLDVLCIAQLKFPSALETKVSPDMPTCPVCNKSFSMNKLLTRHIKTIHSANNPHTCNDCGKRCRSQSELKIHQRVHTRERPHVCGTCNKAFTQVSHLNDHMNNVHIKKEAKLAKAAIVGELIEPDFAQQSVVIDEEEDINTEVASVEKENAVNPPKKPVRLVECRHSGCERTFRSMTSMKFHALTHVAEEGSHERRPYRCDVCAKSFTQKSHLTVHSRVHTGQRPHMCSYCGKQFSVRSNLKKHLTTHEKASSNDDDSKATAGHANFAGAENVCDFCNKTFATASDLVAHGKTHASERPHECPDCQRVFRTRSALKVHEKTHTGKMQHVCEFCQLACLSKSSLDKHMLTHTGEKPFECLQCGKSFKQKSHVNYHVRTVHGPPPGERPRNHVCFECGSAFTTSSTLNKHLKTHSFDRPHVCKLCNKGFIQKVHLETHMLRHSGERPWLCNECGRGFVTAGVLREHAKQHAQVARKTFTCAECGACYANAADLAVHLHKHAGTRPFACPKCPKAFRSKRMLADHERAHAGEKPFSCSNCAKTFTTASGLRQHFRRHDTCKLTSLPGAFGLQKIDQAVMFADLLNPTTVRPPHQDDVMLISEAL